MAVDARGFALPQAALGLVLAGVSTGTFVAGMLTGRIMQAMKLGTVLLGSTCVAMLGLAGMAGAVHPVMLVAAAVVLGIGTGTLDSSVNAAAAMRFSARQVNWMHGCYGIGATLGPLLMTALVVTGGLSWRVGYGVLTAVMALVGVTFARVRQRNPEPRSARAADGGSGWGDAVRHPLVLLQIALFFVYCGLEVMLGQWSFTVLTESRGVSPAVAGAWTSAYWVSLAGGRFALGWALDHIAADRLLRGATLGVVSGAFIFALAPGSLGVIGLMLAGVSLAPIFPTLMSRGPQRLGPAIALHAAGFNVSAAMVGAAVIPAAAGLLAQFAGLAAIGWAGAGVAVLVLLMHEAVMAHAGTMAPLAPPSPPATRPL